MRELDPREMRGAAGTGDREVQFPRLGFRERDELRDRRDGNGGMNDEKMRRVGHHRHRCEVLDRVERQFGIDTRADGERADIGEQHRIAVGRRPADELRAHVAIGARLVLDDDRLATDVGELRSDRARENIGGTAGGVRDEGW